MNMNRSTWIYVIVPTLLISAGFVAYANDAVGPPVLVPKVENNISYLSGGIGDEQIGTLRARRDGYNLRLIFALAQTGAYLANARVMIDTSTGTRLLDVISEGPIFYAAMPAGRYKITSEIDGVSQTRFIEVADGRLNRFVLYWSPHSEVAGGDATGG